MPKKGFGTLTLKNEVLAKLDILCQKTQRSRPQMLLFLMENYTEEHDVMCVQPEATEKINTSEV